MKKAFAVLLALAVLGGAVFAQAAAPAAAPALKLGGTINGGYAISGDTDGLPDIAWTRYQGASLNAFQVRLNGSYTNENASIGFRLQSRDFGAMTFTRAWGQMKFFDGKFTTRVGKLADYTFATAFNAWGNYDSALGLQLVVAPIDGLKIGYWIPEDLAADTLDLVTNLKDSDVGFAYSAEGLGDFVLNLNMKNGTAFAMDTYFGFNLTAVENLTGQLEVKVAGLTAGATPAMTFFENVAYTMDKLEAGMYMYQIINGADIELDFYPNVTYSMDTMTISAEIGVEYPLGGTLGWYVAPNVNVPVKSKASIDFGAKVAAGVTYNVYSVFNFAF